MAGKKFLVRSYSGMLKATPRSLEFLKKDTEKRS
jgi:hypothetical protein